MQDAIQLLLKSDLLSGVAEADLRALRPPPEWVRLGAGETLIRQGMPGEALYLLVRGRLRVFVSEGGGRPRRLADVLSGEYVGEMSLVSGSPTSATVRAMHDCELIRFSRASYLQLIERSPEVVLHITRTVIERLRQVLRSGSRTLPYARIAVLPLDKAVDASRFVATLTEHLNRFAATAAIDGDQVDLATFVPAHVRPRSEAIEGRDRRVAPGGPEFDLIVYHAHAEPSNWTRLCIRHADLVLLVTTVDSDAALTEAEHTMIRCLDPELSPRLDFVLLHGGQWRLSCGARKWLASRDAAQVHHLRQGRDEDFARLARILTGNAIEVVLSGGGARGFAHIGVLQALREAGVPIDRVGGTSMGSMVGALFAMGLRFDEIVRICRQIFVAGKPGSDYTFPALSIVRGRRLHNMVKDALGDWQIEDLPITFYCVSADLTENDLVVHDRGSLWEAVRASGSIPGAGPPMFRDGLVLIDGGVLNNLPVDIMCQRYGGITIAVDAARQAPLLVPKDTENAPSGWGILWRRLNPFDRREAMPSIFDILYGTATLGSSRLSRLNRALADLVLIPPVANFGTFEFRAIDELVRVGHRYASERLRQLEGGRLAPFVALDGPSGDGAPEPREASTAIGRSAIRIS